MMDKKILYHRDRPVLDDWLPLVFDGFFELHGDRLYGDDEAMKAGLALLGGRTVTVIGHAKGKNTKDNIRRNFGMPHPEGYRKALRLMKQAEKFRRPIICFVDTSGAFCGIGAEERGQGEAIARNLMEMMFLNTPIIAVFTGEGGSGGALALAVADRVMMLEHAVYSVISPKGCASILWKDPSREDEAAEKLKITAADLKAYGVAETIIPEHGGAHLHPGQVAADLRAALLDCIQEVQAQEDLLGARYARFRALGIYNEEA